jgi:hypothetical protein
VAAAVGDAAEFLDVHVHQPARSVAFVVTPQAGRQIRSKTVKTSVRGRVTPTSGVTATIITVRGALRGTKAFWSVQTSQSTPTRKALTCSRSSTRDLAPRFWVTEAVVDVVEADILVASANSLPQLCPSGCDVDEDVSRHETDGTVASGGTFGTGPVYWRAKPRPKEALGVCRGPLRFCCTSYETALSWPCILRRCRSAFCAASLVW